MKILLLEPPFERFQGIKRAFFPLGLAYVAAYIEARGHTVEIYDVEHTKETNIIPYAEAANCYQKFLAGLNNPEHPIWLEIKAELERFRPQLIGISCPTVKYAPALKIAELAKQLEPEIKVVLGGCHPTVMAEQVLANQVVDFIIRGEGELTLSQLLDFLQSHSPLTDIAGLSYKLNGQVCHNTARQLLPDLNQLPFPARKLLRDAAGYDAEDMGLMMGSRGCPFQCTYCASKNMWSRKVRYRSVQNIIDEICEVKEQFGTSQFSFEDDSFTANSQLIGEFCQQLISRQLHISWSAITRINLLNDELIQKMKRAGCNHIRVGIESGSDTVLKNTKKGLTVAQMRAGAKVLRRHGIYWSAYFMLGLPSETEADVLATIKLMKEIKPDYCTLSIFTPYPGTEIFDVLRQAGMVSEDMDWSRFSHASPHNYFAPQIPRQRFEELLDLFAREVDAHNGNFLRLIKRAKSKGLVYLQQPTELIGDIKKYLSWRKGGA
jgi:anaerobic magnesium-protoporphyrin IX monomethyl ester cyclase